MSTYERSEEQRWHEVSRVLDYVLSFPRQEVVREDQSDYRAKAQRPRRRRKSKEYQQLRLFEELS